MKRPRPVMNFRGLHALLLLPDDQNLVILQRALQRLGLKESRHGPQGPADSIGLGVQGTDGNVLLSTMGRLFLEHRVW